jgi:hypothetical protein
MKIFFRAFLLCLCTPSTGEKLPQPCSESQAEREHYEEMFVQISPPGAQSLRQQGGWDWLSRPWFFLPRTILK